MRSFIRTLLLCFITGAAFGQNLPLGQWQVHVPYQSARDVVMTPGSVWCALEASLVSVDVADYSMMRYTKANGLSDVEPVALAYDDSTGSVIVGYSNANIDIIRGNSVTNIPAVKNALITGDKSINAIYTNNGTAWIACGFGIVRLNLVRMEISDTYFVGPGNSNLKINDIWANDDYVFAASEDGILRGTIDPFVNLSDADNPDAWLRYNFEDNMIPESEASMINVLGTSIYAALDDEWFSMPLTSDTWAPVTNGSGWLTVVSTTTNGLMYVSQLTLDDDQITGARIGTFNGSTFDFVTDNGQVMSPGGITAEPDGDIWYAEGFAGLTLVEGSSFQRFVPNGPYKRTLLNMTYFDGAVYVASTSLGTTLSGDAISLPYGFYESRQQTWSNYNLFNVPGLEGMDDIADIQPIPGENKLLIAAHDNGIIEFRLSDKSVSIKERPTPDDNVYRSIALAGDPQGNVWIANAYAVKTPLQCRRPGGEYVSFSSKVTALLGKPINDITIDQNNQIWLSTAGSGVYVYNYNGTLTDESDDVLKAVNTSFNLPSTDVRALATDDDGEVWIGTAAGMGIVFCPGAIINNGCFVDRICIPRGDTTNFCDNLLENEVINSITIDPANRKWIGTNRGVFLQSADGLTTIHHFTETNSPLLSNQIRSVAIDETNGDVYIGTTKGLNTYRAEATTTDEGADKDTYVYPNPVRPEYRGPIAIMNLPNNASVKIVDVGGNLVYETTSTGGQAVWDGIGPSGDRVQTGVYIVLSASDDGKFKKTAKFVVIH